MKKNMVIMTVTATMIMALICVGFGFHLGTKQVSCSLSEHPDLGVIEIPTTLEKPFATSGELIRSTDEYAWLLPAVSNGIAVKAKAHTDEVWKAMTSYSATMVVPDDIFFYNGSCCSAKVYYPTSVEAGDTGVIAIVVRSDLGYVYCSYCQFLADDDLQIVYGDSDARTASGGELDVNNSRQLSIHFYTGATPEYDNTRRGHVGRYGDGEVTVDFIDTTESGTDDDIWGKI